MIGKLLKHEMRSYWKTFLPLWGGLLALAVINGVSLRTLGDADGAVGYFTRVVPLLVLFGLLMATGVMTLVLVLQRFYRGLLGSEGYLAFTLPVSRRQLIASKLLAALIVETLSVLAMTLTFLLLGVILAGVGSSEIAGIFREIAEFVDDVFGRYPAESWKVVLLALEMLLLAVVSAAGNVLHFYAAMALGHLAGKHRLALSVVAYVGLNIAGQWIVTLLAQFGAASRMMEGIIRWFESADAAEGLNHVAVLFLCAILGSALVGAVLWAITETVLEKRLNLE